MSSRPFTEEVDEQGAVSIQVHVRGQEVLQDPRINRGTAFTEAERAHLGLEGMLPPAVETMEQQASRCYAQYSLLDDDLDKWIFLSQLHDRNEVLFYRLVGEHVTEMLPIVYTPTVGTAIEQFSQPFRRARGVFLNVDDVDGIDRALELTGLEADDVDLIVASDGEAILGIGDWGVGGIDISIGKLAVYTVAAGIDPDRVLAVGLDVGTNREELLTDPRYLGLRRSRARGEEYEGFIDAYVESASRRFPHAILHWEDFAAPTARAHPRAVRGDPAHVRRRHPGNRIDRPRVRPRGRAGLRRPAHRPADRRLRRRRRRRRHRRPDRPRDERRRAQRRRMQPAGSGCSTARGS